MRNHVKNTYANTLDLAQRLVADIPCARFAEIPHEGAKNPAWILSHLTIASGMGADYLGDSAGDLAGVPMEWVPLCMPGSEPKAERGLYATKDEIMGHLQRVHGLLAERFMAAGDDRLAQEFPNPDYRSAFPTLGDAAYYLMAFHEPWHLGQLSAWRRASGLPAPG
jgi:hypothetical protein